MQFATSMRVHCAESRKARATVTNGSSLRRGTLAAPHDAFMEDAMTAQHAGITAHTTPVYRRLGSIESTTPEPTLLATLQTFRPQWRIRLVPIESVAVPRYRVEIEYDAALIDDGHIDAWLHIKSALMATFPADKPNAVTAIDP